MQSRLATDLLTRQTRSISDKMQNSSLSLLSNDFSVCLKTDESSGGDNMFSERAPFTAENCPIKKNPQNFEFQFKLSLNSKKDHFVRKVLRLVRSLRLSLEYTCTTIDGNLCNIREPGMSVTSTVELIFRAIRCAAYESARADFLEISSVRSRKINRFGFFFRCFSIAKNKIA